MKDSLLLYLNQRLGKNKGIHSPVEYAHGPVITISREVGCGGIYMACKLIEQLNKKREKRNWEVFSKEIFEKTAKELEMDHHKMSRILRTEGRNSFDEILGALGSKRFKSERRIQKAVFDTIKDIATDGYCVIVGRGAHLITHEMEDSLHIRFHAPFLWRKEQIMKRRNMSEKEAVEYINKTEKERESIRRNIHPKNMKEEPFDLEINVAVFSSVAIVELIEKAMALKVTQ